MQEELSSLQEPTKVIHIQICDQANANVPMKISVHSVVALYDTGTNMSCTSYACYMKLKVPTLLKMISVIPVNLAISHDLCPLGLTCYEGTRCKSELDILSSYVRNYRNNLLSV